MATTPLALSAPPATVLVISLRRLGDALITTPLIRSLKQAWPEAAIDALVLPACAGVLAGNPDLRQVLTMPGRGQIGFALGLWRRYDLALAATNSDRSHTFAVIAGRQRLGVGPKQPGWKRRLLDLSVTQSTARYHAVTQTLLLADRLGIARAHDVVPPQPDAEGLSALDAALGPGWAQRRYAVVHPEAMYRYKSWTADGWRTLIRWLAAQGLEVVLSGGPAAAERAAVQALADAAALPAGALHVVAGKLPFAALTPLIEHAALYVGPDTSVTHLAAGTGRPTLALFGPSSPLTWGPWPQGWDGQDGSPWRLAAPLQRIGNVAILQGDRGRRIGCIPCLKEGCEQRLDSASDCLDRLSAERVIAAAAQLLG